jgi:hypothetical protein
MHVSIGELLKYDSKLTHIFRGFYAITQQVILFIRTILILMCLIQSLFTNRVNALGDAINTS